MAIRTIMKEKVIKEETSIMSWQKKRVSERMYIKVWHKKWFKVTRAEVMRARLFTLKVVKQYSLYALEKAKPYLRA